MRRGRCVVVVFKAPHFPRNWGLIQGAPPGEKQWPTWKWPAWNASRAPGVCLGNSYHSMLRPALSPRPRPLPLFRLACYRGSHGRRAKVLGLASAANDTWLADHGVIPVAYGEGVADRIRAASGGKVPMYARPIRISRGVIPAVRSCSYPDGWLRDDQRQRDSGEGCSARQLNAVGEGAALTDIAFEPVSSNRSLRCGETEFSRRRQRGRNGLGDSGTPAQRQNLARQPR